MPGPQAVAILNELLSLEQSSLACRLLEATVAISTSSVPALRVVQSMSNASREHGAALAKLILDMGGSPAPRHYLISTADLHFQNLQFVLPRLVAEQEALVRSYTFAAQRLSDDLRALALVSRILQQHQEDFRSLSELAPAAKQSAR